MNTELAWQVIWIAAAVGALALWATLWWIIPARARLGGVWRWCLVALVVVFFILPAPVPNFAGFEAPAFVVMLFEALFQSAGSPEESMRRLLVTGLAVLALAAAVLVARRFMRER